MIKYQRMNEMWATTDRASSLARSHQKGPFRVGRGVSGVMDGYRWMQKGGGNNNSGEETRLRESDIDQVNENWTKWMKAWGVGSEVEKAMLVFPSARVV